MLRIIVGACTLAACLAAGCSRQESAWDRAARSDTVAGYDAYLDRFPAGTHAGEARARIVELRDTAAWTRAERLGTPEAWQRYLGEWPQGRHAEDALERLAEFMPPASPARPGPDFEAQLGAFSSAKGAENGVERIRREHRELLGTAALWIRSPEPGEAAVFRVRAGPFTPYEARELCVRFLAAGEGCLPVVGAPGEAP